MALMVGLMKGTQKDSTSPEPRSEITTKIETPGDRRAALPNIENTAAWRNVGDLF
jgi:hypothetical protein